MWVKKFTEHGKVLNLNAKGKRDDHSVRPKTARPPVNIEAVRDSVGHYSRRIWSQNMFLELSKAS